MTVVRCISDSVKSTRSATIVVRFSVRNMSSRRCIVAQDKHQMSKTEKQNARMSVMEGDHVEELELYKTGEHEREKVILFDL